MTYFLRQFLRYNLGPVICIFWLRQKMQIYGPKLYRETDAGINNHFLWTLWHFGNDNKVRVGYHDTPTYCLAVCLLSWKPVHALSFLHSWRIRSRPLLWACLKNATFEDVCLSLLSAPGVQFNRKLWLDSKLRIQIFKYFVQVTY